MDEGEVRLVDLVKRFGDFTAVDGINLDMPSGEFFSMLGPSGCGKTTTLRMIAGFERPSEGQILLDGEDVTWDLRRPEINQMVSIVAAVPGVRLALLDRQREIGRRGRVVMVGRDIGTTVLPTTGLKIYLTVTQDGKAETYSAAIAGGEMQGRITVDGKSVGKFSAAR